MSYYAKRKPRCGYCYQEGHNRNSCPSIKAAAANGDEYAKERLERAKIKRCSYCKNDGHTKATCERKFGDDLSSGWSVWTGINAVVNIIREKKLAKGAFVYGPIQHRWTDYPAEVTDRSTNEPKPNYEMINFCIDGDDLNEHTVLGEWSNHLGYTTLAEIPDGVRLKGAYSLPGFYEAVLHLDKTFEYGKQEWIKKNEHYVLPIGRKNSVDLCTILVEAPQEEVDKIVNKLLEKKPMIVDYTDRKAYQSAIRAQNKKIKNELNDEED